MDQSVTVGKPFTGILFSKATTDEPRIQCEYKNGKRHGEYIAFDSKDENEISRTKYYKNGLLHGKDTLIFLHSDIKVQILQNQHYIIFFTIFANFDNFGRCPSCGIFYNWS